jgi:hypothetical protein
VEPVFLREGVESAAARATADAAQEEDELPMTG